MKYRTHTTFIAFFLLLLVSKNSFSQDDSTIPVKEDLAEHVVRDTVLNRTKFNEVDDSMNVYRLSKDFAYMRYMDSLLRKRSDLTVDTISGNALKGGKFKKDKLSDTPATPRRSISLNFLNSPVVKIIFWVLAIGFIGLILYKLFLTGGIFKSSKPVNTPSDEPQEEVLEPSAYDRLIAKAVADKNFRLATRYWYLQTLQKLSAAGSIQFSTDKTNYEYVRELGNRNYQKEFASLTTNYEYVWYGKFDVSDDIYERLQKDFKFFHQKI